MALSEQDFGQDTAQIRAPVQREIIYRHSLVVRLTHWVNLLCLTLLLMSGLALFNVHPSLYWGHYGYPGVPTVFSISGRYDPELERPVGTTRIGDYSFETTGFLGVTYGSEGQPRSGAFPESARNYLPDAESMREIAVPRCISCHWQFLVNG